MSSTDTSILPWLMPLLTTLTTPFAGMSMESIIFDAISAFFSLVHNFCLHLIVLFFSIILSLVEFMSPSICQVWIFLDV